MNLLGKYNWRSSPWVYVVLGALPLVSNAPTVRAAIEGPLATLKFEANTERSSVAVNETTNRIYVSGKDIHVIDGNTNQVITKIDGNGFGDVAINSATNIIYTVQKSGDGGVVVAIDGNTNQLTVTDVEVASQGDVPNAIAVNTTTNRVYVASRGGALIIDGNTNRRIGTIGNTVDAFPIFYVRDVAVNPITNRVFLTLFEGYLGAYNGATGAALYSSGDAYSASPRGPVLAVNARTNTLLVGADSAALVDGRSYQRIGYIDANSPPAVAVNPSRNQYYLSFSSELRAIDGATTTTTGTLRGLTRTIFDLAVNQRTGLIYAVSRGEATFDFLVFRDTFEANADNDTIAPTVAITSPSNGARLTSLLQVTGTALDNRGGSGISRVALFLKRSSDGKYWTGRNWSTTQTELRTTLGAFNANGQAFTNADPLPSGENLKQDTYFLTAVAIDRANAFGNRAVTTVSFRVIDVIDPQIAITYPSDGALLSQLTKISGTLTDNAGGSGPSRVLLQIRRSSDRKYFDGTMWTSSAVTLSTELIGSGEAVAWQRVRGLPPVVSARDVYTITAIGYDRAFNRDDASVTITVGTAATAT